MAGQPNAMALHSFAPRSLQARRYWATDGSSEASRKDASDAPAVAHTLVDMRKAAAAKVGWAGSWCLCSCIWASCSSSTHAARPRAVANDGMGAAQASPPGLRAVRVHWQALPLVRHCER